MAEETKGIRLKKAATELNVGINTLVDFLAKKGHQVENNPNTRLTAEQYGLVEAAFQAERAVKEQADKIEITPSGNNVVVAAEPEEAIVESEEVIIKNFPTSDSKGTQQPVETAVTPDEPEAPAPVSEPAPEPTYNDADALPTGNLFTPATIGTLAGTIDRLIKGEATIDDVSNVIKRILKQ